MLRLYPAKTISEHDLQSGGVWNQNIRTTQKIPAALSPPFLFSFFRNLSDAINAPPPPTFVSTQVSQCALYVPLFAVELVSIVADTDYSNWAVLVQCHERGAGSGADSPLFLSTRVLSRTRSLSSAHWMEVQDAVEKADAGAPHRCTQDTWSLL